MKEHKIIPPHLVNLIGKNGSGKGRTTAEYINQEAQTGRIVLHISTGDVLRVAHSRDTEHDLAKKYGHLIDRLQPPKGKKDRMTQGDLVVGTQEAALQEIPRLGVIEATLKPEIDVVILDGTTRTIGQWNGMKEFLKKYKKDVGVPINLTHVYLDVPDEIVIKRSEDRVKEYIRDGKTPRKDDDPEKVLLRLEVFKKQTIPLIQLLQEGGMLHKIDSSKPIETVVADFTSIVEKAALSDEMYAASFHNRKHRIPKHHKHS